MRVLTLLLALALPLSLMAQEASLSVKVSRDTVLMDNQVMVTFTANNTSGDFIEPELHGLKVVSGPFTSSSYVFSNGNSSRTITYTYYLEPEHEGVVTIGKAKVKNDNHELSTSEITLYAKANPKGIKQSPDGGKEKTDHDQAMGDFWNKFPSFDDFFKDPTPAQKTPPREPAKEKYKFKTEKL